MPVKWPQPHELPLNVTHVSMLGLRAGDTISPIAPVVSFVSGLSVVLTRTHQHAQHVCLVLLPLIVQTS